MNAGSNRTATSTSLSGRVRPLTTEPNTYAAKISGLDDAELDQLFGRLAEGWNSHEIRLAQGGMVDEYHSAGLGGTRSDAGDARKHKRPGFAVDWMEKVSGDEYFGRKGTDKT